MTFNADPFVAVVSYSISTSNHNAVRKPTTKERVVSYSISTSNHNITMTFKPSLKLYLIPFLHQTTTNYHCIILPFGCILFHFYIKPQPCVHCILDIGGCILFHFYIKPQQPYSPEELQQRCILFHFYIKPQLPLRWMLSM